MPYSAQVFRKLEQELKLPTGSIKNIFDNKGNITLEIDNDTLTSEDLENKFNTLVKNPSFQVLNEKGKFWISIFGEKATTDFRDKIESLHGNNKPINTSSHDEIIFQLLQKTFNELIAQPFQKHQLNPNKLDILEHSLLLMAGIKTYPGTCNYSIKDTNITIHFKLLPEDFNRFTSYITQQGAEILYLGDDKSGRQMVQTTIIAILSISPMIDNVLSQLSQSMLLPIYKILFEQKQYEAAWNILSSAWPKIEFYSSFSTSSPQFQPPHLSSPITPRSLVLQPSTFSPPSENSKGKYINPEAIPNIEQNLGLKSGTILVITYFSQNQKLEIHCLDEVCIAAVLSVLNLNQEPKIDTVLNTITIQGAEAENLSESFENTDSADLTMAIELCNR